MLDNVSPSGTIKEHQYEGITTIHKDVSVFFFDLFCSKYGTLKKICPCDVHAAPSSELSSISPRSSKPSSSNLGEVNYTTEKFHMEPENEGLEDEWYMIVRNTCWMTMDHDYALLSIVNCWTSLVSLCFSHLQALETSQTKITTVPFKKHLV